MMQFRPERRYVERKEGVRRWEKATCARRFGESDSCPSASLLDPRKPPLDCGELVGRQLWLESFRVKQPKGCHLVIFPAFQAIF